MPRVLLTLVYLIAAVCGPRPCCCAAPAPARPVQPVPAPAAPKCPLCAAAEKKPDQPEPARKHDCPCQKSRPVPTPHAVPAPADDLRLIPTDGPFAVPLHTAYPQATAELGLRVRVFGPPPDPSAHLPLLCHRLRC